MRRKDREVLDRTKIKKIIDSCYCCRLGFCDNGNAYIVPLNFGYEENEEGRIFYFHSASEGRKIDLIKVNNKVGFELDTNYKLNEAAEACGYSASFQSIIGTGKVYFIEEIEEKIHALNCIMYHNTGKKDWEFPHSILNKMAIFKLKVDQLSCKEHE